MRALVTSICCLALACVPGVTSHQDGGVFEDGGNNESSSLTLSITAPAASATVLGTVMVYGTSSGAVKVELQVDSGAFEQVAGTDAWSAAWDTTSAANGAHTLTARATDAVGKTKVVTAGVTVDNATGATGTCDRNATTSTFAAEFSATTSGQTLCLAAGTYSFHGGTKAGRVTVRAASGADVKMSVDFNGAQNITIDAVTITSLAFSHSRDITVSHSHFTGQAIVQAGAVADANLVFDGNDHRGVLTCGTCFAAQLHLDAEGTQRSGITIRNSKFGDSFADGIRPDVNSSLIEGNEFSGFDDQDPYHTDPIQFYGGHHATIRRNYFHDNHVAGCISAWDGTDHNVIEDNVIVGSTGTGEAIAMLSDTGSIVRHNTLVQGTCLYGWHCGIIDVAHKSSDPATNGTVITDNILSDISAQSEAVNLTVSNNLNNTSKTPLYVNPSLGYEGYRLSASSPGKGAASDGLDVGIR